jgi:hypothetical protein
MKFEDDAQIQLGDKNVDRSQGAARAISVRLQSYLRMAFTISFSHLLTRLSPGKTYRGSRASQKASLPDINIQSANQLGSAYYSQGRSMLGRCIASTGGRLSRHRFVQSRRATAGVCTIRYRNTR